MKNVFFFLVSLVVSCIVFSAVVRGDDWPGFRGGKGGVAPEQDLPTQVTKDSVLWKVKLPGVGASSPIVFGDKVFVTAYAGYGTTVSKGSGGGKGGFGGGKGGFGGGKGGFGKGGPADPGQKKLKLLLLCLDRGTGDIAWQKEIEPKLPEVAFSGMIREHGYATSTPTTDGERIYAFFGKSGVVAFDLKGTQVWRADVGSSTHIMGSAASPVLYKDLVIVNAAIESQSLVGLDKKTGKEVWRTKGLGTCWATPVLAETKAGTTEVVLSLPGKIVGYDPQTGKELWRCTGIGSAGGYGGTSPSPVAKDGVVYVSGGGGPSPSATIAVKCGGTGDVTKTHVVWRQKVAPSYASAVLVGDYLCWVDGSLQCLSLADGKTAYKNRVYDSRGEYVSPVVTGSKIYALTRSNGLFVLDGAGKFERLAHLEFSGDNSLFNGCPAVSDGRLYLRSNAYLYCIGKKS